MLINQFWLGGKDQGSGQVGEVLIRGFKDQKNLITVILGVALGGKQD